MQRSKYILQISFIFSSIKENEETDSTSVQALCSYFERLNPFHLRQIFCYFKLTLGRIFFSFFGWWGGGLSKPSLRGTKKFPHAVKKRKKTLKVSLRPCADIWNFSSYSTALISCCSLFYSFKPWFIYITEHVIHISFFISLWF